MRRLETLDPGKVDQTLRMVSQLRDLVHQLPHCPTPKEKQLLREFEEYRKKPGFYAQTINIEAIYAGFKHYWRLHAHAAIIEMAERLPESVFQENPDLLIYYHYAATIHGGQRE